MANPMEAKIDALVQSAYDDRLSREEADTYFHAALELARAEFGPDSLVAFQTMAHLGRFRASLGKAASAEGLLHGAFFGFFNNYYMWERPALGAALSLGTVLDVQGRFDEAHMMLCHAVQGYSTAVGPEKVFLVDAVRALLRSFHKSCYFHICPEGLDTPVQAVDATGGRRELGNQRENDVRRGEASEVQQETPRRERRKGFQMLACYISLLLQFHLQLLRDRPAAIGVLTKMLAWAGDEANARSALRWRWVLSDDEPEAQAKCDICRVKIQWFPHHACTMCLDTDLCHGCFLALRDGDAFARRTLPSCAAHAFVEAVKDESALARGKGNDAWLEGWLRGLWALRVEDETAMDWRTTALMPS